MASAGTVSLIRSPSPDAIAEAAKALLAGKLVGMPTETVYGLAADATNEVAVSRIYTTKGRPSFNPLIVHCEDLDLVKDLIELSPEAGVLAGAYWPGPLTLVGNIKQTNTVCELARAGLDSLAVRIPGHPTARALLKAVGRPLVAPSANPSGQLSPTSAQHVADDLGEALAMILDGGPTERGVESTIVDVRSLPFHVLRAGPIPRSEIESHVGKLAAKDLPVTSERPTSPGQLLRHYAPNARLRLNVRSPNRDEAWLGFGDCPGATLNLSPSGDIPEAERNLFSMLRILDQTHDRIAVAPIPVSQLSEALHDRLARAAESD